MLSYLYPSYRLFGCSVVRLFVYSVLRLFGCSVVRLCVANFSFIRVRLFGYSCSFIRLFVSAVYLGVVLTVNNTLCEMKRQDIHLKKFVWKLQVESDTFFIKLTWCSFPLCISKIIYYFIYALWAYPLGRDTSLSCPLDVFAWRPISFLYWACMKVCRT